MRLVINTGFFNSFFDRANTFFRATVTTASTRRVISHLENVRNRTNSLSAGGAVRLGGTLEAIQARINRENARLDAIGEVVRRSRDFRTLAINTDRSVEQDMQQLHGEFFEVNHWARPSLELESSPGFWQNIWRGIIGAGTWIADRGQDAWNWVTGSPRANQGLKNIRSALPGIISSPLSRAELLMTGGDLGGWDVANYTWGSISSSLRKGGPLKNPLGWGLGVISDSIRFSVDSFRQNRATTDYSARGIGSALLYGIRNPREFARALSGSVDEVIKAIKFW